MIVESLKVNCSRWRDQDDGCCLRFEWIQTEVQFWSHNWWRTKRILNFWYLSLLIAMPYWFSLHRKCLFSWSTCATTCGTRVVLSSTMSVLVPWWCCSEWRGALHRSVKIWQFENLFFCKFQSVGNLFCSFRQSIQTKEMIWSRRDDDRVCEKFDVRLCVRESCARWVIDTTFV